ncbi:MAG: FG-GAP repeat protein, partial [Planctomycetota bacterium]|nr:FG-GAP repeat protein [Planctomycetota bacterium]
RDGFSSGSAYVFRFDPENSHWVEEQKLLASDGAVFDQFGRAVAIDGDTLVIGAFDHEDDGPVLGAAYVFRFDPDKSGSWIEQQKLLPTPNPWTNFFGLSVAIDGDTTVIGAHGEDHQAGAAYIFDLAACLCPADLDGDGTVGILDLLALLAAWGTDPGGPPDFDNDGTVGILDLLTLLAIWGPCP